MKTSKRTLGLAAVVALLVTVPLSNDSGSALDTIATASTSASGRSVAAQVSGEWLREDATYDAMTAGIAAATQDLVSASVQQDYVGPLPVVANTRSEPAADDESAQDEQASLPAAAAAKMSGAVQRLARQGGNGPAEIIVSYAEYPELFEAGRVESLGGEVVRRYESLDMLAVSIPADALVDLAFDDTVDRLSLDDQVISMGSEKATANFPAAGSSNSFYAGSNVGVAVVDSGITDHLDLAATVLQYSFVDGEVPAPTVENGQITAFNDDSREDKYGHGTHVAGIIAGDGTGASEYTGLSGGATLLSLQALDHKGQGSTSDVIAALDWIATYGSYFDIRIVNLSLGQGVTESIATDPLVAAVNNLWDMGYVVVVAAGNYGNYGYGTIMSPANSRKVITVGSLTDNGTGDDASDDYVSSFSSRGPTLGDMVLKPDLLAPGNRIIATMGKTAKLKKDLPSRVINCNSAGCGSEKYLELSGTSMAAPVVSSAVAMMLEKDPTLSPSTIKARLMRSATKIDAPPIEAGAGVLNIDAALDDTGIMTGQALSPLMQLDEDSGGVYIEDTSLLWGDEVWGSGYLWTNGYLWTDGGTQASGYLWTDGGGAQANGYLWTDGVNANGYLWTDGAEAAGYLWTDGGGSQANGILDYVGETLVLNDDP